MPSKKVNKRLTRKLTNDSKIDKALRDIYDKIDNLQPLTNKYSELRDIADGTLAILEGGSLHLGAYKNGQWMVDINSEFKPIGTKSLKSSVGAGGRSGVPVKGESIKYNHRRIPAIKSATGDSTILLKNDSGILKFRNSNDSADAEIRGQKLRLSAIAGDDVGDIGFGDAVGETFKINCETLWVNGITSPAGTDSRLLLACEDQNDSFVTFQDGSSAKWTVGQQWSATASRLSDLLFCKGNTMGSNVIFRIKHSGTDAVLTSHFDDTNYSTITTAANGATTIATTDSDGAVGHLTLAPNGNLLSSALQNIFTSTTADQLVVQYDGSNYGLMNVASDGHLEIESVGTDADMTLNAAGTIELNADAGEIFFKDGLASLAAFSRGSLISYYNGSNYFTIGTTSAGVSTLSTTGGTATDADFIVDAGGDITLDSGTGVFIAKKAGTEFSSANSAYAGMILGYTRIQNDGTSSGESNITVNSSSMTVLTTAHLTELKVTFVAPPSGNVEIQCSFWLSALSDGVKFALSDNVSFNEVDETHTYDADQTIYLDETDHNYNTILFSESGLTAGTEYTRWIAGLASGGGVNISHGRNRTAGTHFPPIIIKAIALPSTITTGE